METKAKVGYDILSYYKGKTVFITGHTGFKGTWLTRILLKLGAKVIGYSLEAPTSPALFDMAGFDSYISSGQFISILGDVRNLQEVIDAVTNTKPDVLFHLAAQPIVRESYKNPVYTYETNVMGTVNILEAVRRTTDSRASICDEWKGFESVVIVTTDKVYKNAEREIWGYRECEELDGFDPYSNSKSCAELVVHSYRDSFFRATKDAINHKQRWSVPISTARAGNVIGGGDFANDRIIPDCVKAIQKAIGTYEDEAIISVRNPYSIRPYQHVLEPLAIYLTLAAAQVQEDFLADCYNVGPDDCDCVTTGDLTTLFCESWNEILVRNKEKRLPRVLWENKAEVDAPHEASFLKLDSTKIKLKLGYQPRWHIKECIDKTVEFTEVYLTGGDIPAEMDRQIEAFFNGNLVC